WGFPRSGFPVIPEGESPETRPIPRKPGRGPLYRFHVTPIPVRDIIRIADVELPPKTQNTLVHNACGPIEVLSLDHRRRDFSNGFPIHARGDVPQPSRELPHTRPYDSVVLELKQSGRDAQEPGGVP